MKKIQLKILCSILTISLCGATLNTSPEFPKLMRASSELVPNENKILPAGREPTCEELKTIWRFSRRQSRAAEITNEIPTYRDPFIYNVWDQYPSVESEFGRNYMSGRSWSKPVYGRIIRKAPKNHPRFLSPESRSFNEVMNYFDNGRLDNEFRRKFIRPSNSIKNILAKIKLIRENKFQNLKEKVRTDREKDIRHQRFYKRGEVKFAMPKNIPQYDENILNHRISTNSINKINNNEFDEERKTGRMRLLISDIDNNDDDDDDDSAFAPDLFWTPYRERSAYDSEPSNEGFW